MLISVALMAASQVRCIVWRGTQEMAEAEGTAPASGEMDYAQLAGYPPWPCVWYNSKEVRPQRGRCPRRESCPLKNTLYLAESAIVSRVSASHFVPSLQRCIAALSSWNTIAIETDPS
jgi:hypothetical protein